MNEFNEYWKPDVIVLGPGGIKGFLELGALLRLEKSIKMKDVFNWVGCSVGAAISLLIVVGYTIQEIIDICKDIKLLNDITDLTNIDVSQISERMGLFSLKSIEKKLEEKVIKKYGIVLSLKKLYMATGKRLTIVTYNLDRGRTEYFDYLSEPNISCIHAVMMSMSIPFIMQSRHYKSHDYIDGALGNPYPIDIHDDGTKIILGICVINKMSENKNVFYRMFKMLNNLISEIRNKIIEFSSNKCYHLMLQTSIFDTTGITISDTQKQEMIDIGYQEGSVFIDKIYNPEKHNILLKDDEEIPIIENELEPEFEPEHEPEHEPTLEPASKSASILDMSIFDNPTYPLLQFTKEITPAEKIESLYF
jgi:predicted acylesterase/phospholipase RssA